jgi:dihydrofolate synthase/folylpolyglutamate synthase
MNRLGNPQDDLQCVHVAGTNGKGSTIAFLGAILKCAGYKVGAYTSPALVDWKENIRINGKQQLTNKDADRLLAVIRQASEGLTPSQFETETALAFLYFKEQRVDYALIECGMGGLHDATNVIKKPALAVITSLSLDHTEILGRTLEEIRRHKEGIIKGGAVVRAETLGEIIVKEAGITKQVFSCGDFEDCTIRLGGAYQPQNAALAVEAAVKLGVKKKYIYAGLKKAEWHGRFTVLGEKPLFVVDGAHNPAGAAALRQTVDACFGDKRLILLAGIFRDKDADGMLKIMAPGAAEIILLDMPENKRLMRAAELRTIVIKYNDRVQVSESPADAVRKALTAAGKDGAVVSFGSLSTIDAVTKTIREIAK